MKITNRSILFFISIIIFSSCVTSAYITDKESIERQKKMRKYRTGINFAEVGLIFASAVGEAYSGVNIYPQPSQQSFRKMVLVNKSTDTLFVNMVTDWHWRDSSYCDIREIVLPSHQSAKVLVPMGAIYNVFFRNDFYAPDDEKIEINTANVTRVRLKPVKDRLKETNND